MRHTYGSQAFCIVLWSYINSTFHHGFSTCQRQRPSVDGSLSAHTQTCTDVYVLPYLYGLDGYGKTGSRAGAISDEMKMLVSALTGSLINLSPCLTCRNALQLLCQALPITPFSASIHRDVNLYLCRSTILTLHKKLCAEREKWHVGSGGYGHGDHENCDWCVFSPLWVEMVDSQDNIKQWKERPSNVLLFCNTSSKAIPTVITL